MHALHLMIFGFLLYYSVQVQGICDQCQQSNMIACHTKTQYSLCVAGKPTYNVITCPEDTVCSEDLYICVPDTGAEKVCNRNDLQPASVCGECASANKVFACLDEITIAFCFGRDEPDVNAVATCPVNTVCDLNNPLDFCSFPDEPVRTCLTNTDQSTSVSTSSTPTTQLSTEITTITSVSTSTTNESTTIATAATTESTTQSTTEATTQSTTEATTEAATEAATDATTEAATDATTEAATEATTEAATEATTEAATEAATEATTPSTTQSTTEAATEATTQSTTQSAASEETTTEIPIETTSQSTSGLTSSEVSSSIQTDTTTINTVSVLDDLNGFCEKKGPGSYLNTDDPSCRSFIYCVRQGGNWIPSVVYCDDDYPYFNEVLGMCSAQKPATCTSS